MIIPPDADDDEPFPRFPLLDRLRARLTMLVGWPGVSCPLCGARPLRSHAPDCAIGRHDGGIWA